MKKQLLFLTALLAAIALPLCAQDFGFGFNDETETTVSTGGNPSVSVSGEVSATLLGYVSDFADGFDNVNLGDVFSGQLNFSAEVSAASAFIGLKLEPTSSPISIDEAYVRAYFGRFEAEAGLRKLTWGKADSFGPLDVINPLDYSELTDLSSMANFKIARPLVHLSYRIGSFSKIEGVFVPSFEPMRFAVEDSRWVQTQMVQKLVQLQLQGATIGDPPDTSTLDYAQAGLRFTTTIGSADIGLQYYYGRLTRPAFNITLTPSYTPHSVDILYNPYHQIGIDCALVLLGFNIRAEFAANITGDLDGDNGAVYNPHLAWSFGFDRDLFLGINLNVQCNETIRLMDDKITSPYDIEAPTDMISTQIIAALSKTFFKGQLELRAAVFWEVEVGDYMLIPSLILTKDAVSVELSGGIFGGDKDGQFGQYHNNSFVKTVLTYSF